MPRKGPGYESDLPKELHHNQSIPWKNEISETKHSFLNADDSLRFTKSAIKQLSQKSSKIGDLIIPSLFEIPTPALCNLWRYVSLQWNIYSFIYCFEMLQLDGTKVKILSKSQDHTSETTLAIYFPGNFYHLPQLIIDAWYKCWCDYRGGDNRCARGCRWKIILYWIFLIKTSFNKAGGLFHEIIISTSQSSLTFDMLKVVQWNSEATIQKCSLR